MHRTLRLLALALLLGSASLSAKALDLVSPAAGTKLRGGSFETLEWTAHDLPPGCDEWEAFLSLNGGDYYAFRITPHLDLDVQRFVFIVPNVDATDATILIRTGNEVHETVFELPGTFTIVRDPHAGRIPASVGRSTNVRPLGAEAARPGDPAVVAWVDGSRDGSGLTFATAGTACRATLREGVTGTHERASLLEPDQIVVRIPDVEILRRSSLAASPSDVALPPRIADLLLLCRRWNI